MKSSSLSEKFQEYFLGHPVAINSKIQVETPQGTGLMTYRGFLVDYDDNLVYIGVNEEEPTSCIKWEEIASIEKLDLEEEAKRELLNKEPASGTVS
jgi:hypothetical protein